MNHMTHKYNQQTFQPQNFNCTGPCCMIVCLSFFFPPTSTKKSHCNLDNMPETQLDEGLLPGKCKMTYPHDHPMDNPKPPKRSKAEVQQAAKEKRDAELAKKAAAEAEKKKKLLDAEEKCKLSAQQIASVEDSVQHLQKEHQSCSERPDLNTMEIYQKQLQKKKEFIESLDLEEADELEDDDMYMAPLEFLPESTIDTDSDGACLGLSEGDDGHSQDEYEAEDGENGEGWRGVRL